MQAPTHDLNAYPWADVTGLCPLLREPEFWADIFTTPRFRRKAVEKAARSVGLRVDLSTFDPKRTAATVVTIMRTSRGRHALNRALGEAQYPEVAERLLMHYREELRGLPELVCFSPDRSTSYGYETEMSLVILPASDFREWLRIHPLEEEQKRTVAMYACIATMCLPPARPDLALELLHFDVAFATWIEGTEVPDVSPTNHPRPRSVRLRLSPEALPVENLSDLKKDSPVPAVVQGFQEKTLGNASTKSDLGQVRPEPGTVAALRANAECSQDEETTRTQALRDFDARLDRVSELDQQTSQFALLKRDSWLPLGWNAELELLPLPDATAQLEEWENQFGILQHLSDQAAALMEREAAVLPSAILSKDLEAAASELRAIIDDTQASLHSRAEQDSETESLLNAIDAAGDSTGPSPTEALDVQRWKHICGVISRPAEAVNRHLELAGRWDIAGLIVALCWRTQDAEGLQLAVDLALPALRSKSRSATTALLAFLSPAQVQQLALTETAVAPVLCELLIALAVRENRTDLLDYVEPLLTASIHHSVCADYYDSVLSAYRRGELQHPAQQLGILPSATRQFSQFEVDARHRRALREQIGRSPGMQGTYRRMRVIARNLFLKPLEGEVEKASPTQLLAHWKTFEGLQHMVQVCSQTIPKTEKVSESHRHQTYRYLQTFEEELDRWEAETGAASAAAADLWEVKTSWERVRADSSQACRSLVSAFEELAGEARPDWLPARDFFNRVTPEGSARLDFLRGPVFVTPRMTRAWPEAVAREQVPLSVLVHDWLRAVKASGLPPLRVAVEFYLQRAFFAAAMRATERPSDSRLREIVVSRIGRQRADFRRQHAATLSEAQQGATHDRDVRESLLEVERALEEPNLADAREWIDILSTALLEWRERQDPERETLIAFLAEAGETLPTTRTADLRKAANHLCTTKRFEREHIVVLLEAAANTGWPALLRESWRTLGASIDRPSLWFSDGEPAAMLAEAIRGFRTYLQSKWQWRDADPDLVDALMRGFAEWLPAQVRLIIEGSRTLSDPAFQEILELESALAADCPDNHVLAFLGQNRLEKTTADHPADIVDESPQIEFVQHEETGRLKEPVPEILGWQQYRRILADTWNADAVVSTANQRQIKDAVLSERWQDAAHLAAAYLREHSQLLPVAACGDVEAVYALACCFSQNSADSESIEIAAIALHSANCGHYFSDNRLSRLTLETTLRVAGRAVAEAVGKNKEELGLLLQFLREVSLLDLRQHPIGRLFSRANTLAGPKGRTASYWLARVLWRSLEGQANTHVARGELLFLLFRLSLYGELDALASEFSEERPHLVVNCLRAFAYAEAHPEANPQALHLSEALRQGRRLRPWNHLFSLIRLPSEEPEPPVCELASGFLENDGLGRQLIEVRIRPSVDAPESLQLQLGEHGSGGFQVLVHGEPLYRVRVFSVTLPPALVVINEPSLRIPWRLKGRSSRGHSIDIRGAWTVVRTEPALAELPKPILHYWPGARRGPVARERGLHGRDREISEIRRTIFGAGRQCSVMVYGQRRIGKTSVIREISRSLPPKRGQLCGAFIDIAALTLPRDAAGMADSFFSFIVNELDSKENEAIQNCLRTTQGPDATVGALATGLQPQHNLLNAFERLVQRLAEATGGVIERLALFVDEFDRFVEPLLVGYAGSVDTFMWNLRPVVQRAETISLVLAGSGLQRLLTDNYKDALFGSIGQIPIAAFSWEDDQEAILDTFLPREIRSHLCRSDEVANVARHAWEICGGHPMFLALLGAATASVGRGRHWTPALLRDVVEQVVERGISAEGVQVTRGDFYGHIFDSLQRLPLRDQGLAKLLLVNLAEHTTTDFPWLETDRALAPLGLPPHIGHEDCENVFKALIKENAIAQESSRVRIAVPLTASALRRGAPDLHRDAMLGFALARA